MRRTLPEWVDYIQTLHHRQIDLSLERVDLVYRRLAPEGVPFKVISIAGTNGKGSTAELLASIYRSSGYKVGKYTSPHLVAFNERININGCSVSDSELLASFERVEQARMDVPITFFEFGTLLAIDLFLRANLDVVIMEVGLGGRMDAVNILDADVALITNISLDHTAWLGDTVEKIAVEKSGIARADQPCLLGMREPPQSLIRACEEVGAEMETIGAEFDCTWRGGGRWLFTSLSQEIADLSLPLGQAGVQLNNASLAIRATEKLHHYLPVSAEGIRRGLSRASLAGRCQVLQEQPLIILDVSHNQASVLRLRDFLCSQNVKGNIVAVCGMLKDKEIARSLQQLQGSVDSWHLASIAGERGTSGQELSTIMIEQVGVTASDIVCHDRAEQAYRAACATLTADDCLLVFGSFYVVGDILRLLNDERS